MVSVGFMMENLFVAARAKGLGTVPTVFQWFVEDEFRALLGIPAEVEIPLVTPLGYPEEFPVGLPPALAAIRRPWRTLVHDDRWGNARRAPAPELGGERVVLRPAARTTCRRCGACSPTPRWRPGGPCPTRPACANSPTTRPARAVLHHGRRRGRRPDPVLRGARPGLPARRMDIALAANHHGHGLGREALGPLARHLVDVRGHHRLVIDPAAANERAIAAYRRLGFRPVGVMRRYERGPDGTWHDGLLMDMLAAEEAPPSRRAPAGRHTGAPSRRP